MKRFSFGLILLATINAGAQTVPTVNKGMDAKPIGVLDLSKEIEGMGGRQLRARLVSVEAGGTIAQHNHKDRPSVEMLIEGHLIEYRNGAVIEHGPGDIIFSDKDTTHGWENKGGTRAVLFPVDIYHTP